MVFGVDDEAIEDAVARVLGADGLTLGLAESLTGGLAASRLVNVPGASRWFRGSVVSYASEVKFDVLGVPEGPVVSEEAARAMAEGARRVLGADVGLSITGVAGPDPQDDQPPGTVFVGLARPGQRDRVVRVQRARRPRPGPPVRHHRRPRPAAANAPELVGRAERQRRRPVAGSGDRGRSPARRSAGAAPGAAVGVTGMPSGTSSSQVLPGWQGDRRPAGGGQRGRLGEAGPAPGAGDGHAVAHHDQRSGAGGGDLDLVAALAVLDPRSGRRSAPT